MRLWLKEERKESSSSSEKQICLPPAPQSGSGKFLRDFLQICPTSDPSGFSRATDEPLEVEGEAGRLGGRGALVMGALVMGALFMGALDMGVLVMGALVMGADF